jgi:hypothetical protein
MDQRSVVESRRRFDVSGEARRRYLASVWYGLVGQVAQLVEHTTENRGVGGSIPPLATRVFRKIGAGFAHDAKVRSSTGRAPVSKTGGWGFESLRACSFGDVKKRSHRILLHSCGGQA